MTPAYPLVLTNEQHTILGELVEIIGMTEHMLVQSAARFDRAVSENIVKETFKPKASLWANAIRSRLNDPKLAARIAFAEKEIEGVAEERNDFIHALFTGDYAASGYMAPGYQTSSATRSRRATSALQAIYTQSVIALPNFPA